MNQKVLDFVLETIATIFAALCAFHLSAQLPFLIEFPIIFLPLLAVPVLMLLTLGYLLPWSIFAALPIGAVMLFQNPWTLRFILPALLLISAGVAFRYLKQLRRIPVCLAAAVAASLAGVFWDAGLRFWNHAPQQHELRAVSLLNALYGSNLKSDVFQINHHGYSDIPETFFENVNASIALWPTSQTTADLRNKSTWRNGLYLRLTQSVDEWYAADGEVEILILPYRAGGPQESYTMDFEKR